MFIFSFVMKGAMCLKFQNVGEALLGPFEWHYADDMEIDYPDRQWALVLDPMRYYTCHTKSKKTSSVLKLLYDVGYA